MVFLEFLNLILNQGNNTMNKETFLSLDQVLENLVKFAQITKERLDNIERDIKTLKEKFNEMG